MRIVRVSLILFIILLLFGYIYITWFFSNVLIAFEQHSPEQDKINQGIVGGVASFGLPEPNDVQLNNGDVGLTGWFFDNDGAGNCAVMIHHGITGSRYGALKYAPLFWDRGCDLLMMDARRHGNSSSVFGTYGFYEKDDIRVALAWLRQETGLDNAQIGLMGESYGGASVLQAAALEPGLAFVAADSSYQDLISIVREQGQTQYGKLINAFIPAAFWLSEQRANFDADDVSPHHAVTSIASPIFLQHSKQDAYTLAHHTQHIFENILHNRAVLHITNWGAPHGDAIDVQPETYFALMEAFLLEFVPNFGLRNAAPNL